MIQRDLQIMMMQIRRHLRIEAVGGQSGCRNLEKYLILVPAIGRADEHDGQEQYDANLGESIFLKPANDCPHMVKKKIGR